MKQQIYRLYYQHIMAGPNSPMKRSERTFKGGTKASAEKKAERFITNARLSYQVWSLEEESESNAA